MYTALLLVSNNNGEISKRVGPHGSIDSFLLAVRSALLSETLPTVHQQEAVNDYTAGNPYQEAVDDTSTNSFSSSFSSLSDFIPGDELMEPVQERALLDQFHDDSFNPIVEDSVDGVEDHDEEEEEVPPPQPHEPQRLRGLPRGTCA
jgi:hypothetical protein